MIKDLFKMTDIGARLDDLVKEKKINSKNQSQFCLYYVLGGFNLELIFCFIIVITVLLLIVFTVLLVAIFPWILIFFVIALVLFIRKKCKENWEILKERRK